MLIPTQLLANYDVTLSAMGIVIYQFWGASLLGIGLFSWFVRNSDELVLLRRFALVLFITNALNTIFAIRGQYAGANASGWSTVMIFLILALAFGILVINLFLSREPAHLPKETDVTQDKT